MICVDVADGISKTVRPLDSPRRSGIVFFQTPAASSRGTCSIILNPVQENAYKPESPDTVAERRYRVSVSDGRGKAVVQRIGRL
jgi:hypothetical protein